MGDGAKRKRGAPEVTARGYRCSVLGRDLGVAEQAVEHAVIDALHLGVEAAFFERWQIDLGGVAAAGAIACCEVARVRATAR